MCLLAIGVSSLEKNLLLRISAHFHIRLFVFLVLSYRDSLYILDTGPLSDVWFCTFFSPILWVIFSFHSSGHEHAFDTMELLGITNPKAFKSQAKNLNVGGSLWVSSCNSVARAKLSVSVASGSTEVGFGFPGPGLGPAQPQRSSVKVGKSAGPSEPWVFLSRKCGCYRCPHKTDREQLGTFENRPSCTIFDYV